MRVNNLNHCTNPYLQIYKLASERSKSLETDAYCFFSGASTAVRVGLHTYKLCTILTNLVYLLFFVDQH